jgi:hypothetical protein
MHNYSFSSKNLLLNFFDRVDYGTVRRYVLQRQFPCSSSTRLSICQPSLCVLYNMYAQIGQQLWSFCYGRILVGARTVREMSSHAAVRTPSSIPGPNRDNPGNIYCI